MGLKRKQGMPIQEGEQFDIRVTVDEFRHSVKMYTLWKQGMEINVSHIRRRNIPLFVFPGGVRPPRTTKMLGTAGRPNVVPSTGVPVLSHTAKSDTGLPDAEATSGMPSLYSESGKHTSHVPVEVDPNLHIEPRKQVRTVVQKIHFYASHSLKNPVNLFQQRMMLK